MTESDGWDYNLYPGFKTKVIRVGNVTIEVKRPILATEEQAKREATVIQALRGFAKERSN